METKVIARDGLCVEVEEPRWKADRIQRALAAKLYDLAPSGQGKLGKGADAYEVFLEEDITLYTFAVAQTRSHSGFVLPAATDSAEDIYAAFEQVNELPASFVKEWFQAAKALRQPRTHPDLVPPEFLTADQKKVNSSDESEKPNAGGSTKQRKNES